MFSEAVNLAMSIRLVLINKAPKATLRFASKLFPPAVILISGEVVKVNDNVHARQLSSSVEQRPDRLSSFSSRLNWFAPHSEQQTAKSRALKSEPMCARRNPLALWVFMKRILTWPIWRHIVQFAVRSCPFCLPSCLFFSSSLCLSSRLFFSSLTDLPSTDSWKSTLLPLRQLAHDSKRELGQRTELKE